MMAWMQKGMQMMMSKGMGKMGKGKKGGGWTAPVGGTFTCAVHGKQRSANAVIEVGDGTYQCRPDSECKGTNGPKVKSAMCSFNATLGRRTEDWNGQWLQMLVTSGRPPTNRPWLGRLVYCPKLPVYNMPKYGCESKY
eukprot:g30507.t1